MWCAHPSRPDFSELFYDIMQSRYPVLTDKKITGFDLRKLAQFLGITVLGNMRGFIFACNDLVRTYGEQSDNRVYTLGESLLPLSGRLLLAPP